MQLAIVLLYRPLVVTTALCSAVGLLAELLRARLGPDFSFSPALSLLSLSHEGNLPSWYASALPLLCAALLLWISATELSDRRHWQGLALGFLAISIDETVGLHELLSDPFDTTGVLHFGWVIPASLLVLALALAFFNFVRRLHHLSPRTARRCVLAGGLYVGGALLLELPLGWWTAQHGDDNLGYYLIDWCEETLELAGLTLFAGALLTHLAGRSLQLTPRADAPTR